MNSIQKVKGGLIKMRSIKTLFLSLMLLFATNLVASAQIFAPSGNSSKASTQLIYYYDEVDFSNYISVTNTNDSSGVTIHVQIFRSYDPADPGAPVLCDERDFFDFLTPNDTHFYDFSIANFPKNEGENAADNGEATTIDLDNPFLTKGFVIITPVVSEADASAISFQHLIGTWRGTSDFVLNAMGRDAVDLGTGQPAADGTVLDGVANGFVLLQPDENLVDFGVITKDLDIVGIAFTDAYGPAGLLGYNITPGAVTWTPFIFDFLENPTSCGASPIECFGTFGLNDDFGQFNTELTDGVDALLCAGTVTPDYPQMPTAVTFTDFGWLRIFVSNLDELENHLALVVEQFGNAAGARWMYTTGDNNLPGPGPAAENCAVAGDEDGDGLADCADPDCDGQVGPNGENCEATEASCADGQDNDGDGAVDEADTDCDGSEDCPGCEAGDQCADGEDNDGDGNSDCADGGCDGETGPNGETCEAGAEATCDDGDDNDGDGASDCDDSDCAEAANCAGDGGGGGGGGGCTVVSGVTASTAVANFLLPLLAVGFAFMIRRRK